MQITEALPGFFRVWLLYVVVVHEDNVKRSLLKLGKIEKLIVSRDSHMRGAKVRIITKNKPEFISGPYHCRNCIHG